jgi:D-sedoheptulose 7-phosphate isomerase
MTVERVEEMFKSSIATKQALTKTDYATVQAMADAAVVALRSGGKLLFLGNGGSAADAQHLAAELVGRFARERAALPALALSVNTSCLTAIGNDYGYDRVFERQLEALARKGDVVVGISTSGNSPNVLRAIERAKAVGCTTIGMTGRKGGKLAGMVDICFRAPSDDTPRIQEVHITAGHIMCALVEEEMFG